MTDIEKLIADQEKAEKQAEATLNIYAPKMEELFASDLGAYITEIIQGIVETHIATGDVLNAQNPLRSYDTAKGAREVLETLQRIAAYKADA